MKLHERTLPVQNAGIELSGWLLEWVQRHDLTFGETIKLLSLEIEKHARFLIRSERHPDNPEKKGDEA